MGIGNFADLRKWFFAGVKGKNGGEEEGAPHWNLYAGDYGAKELRIQSNTRVNSMNDSYDLLESAIRAQNNPDGTRFRVQTFAPGKANNPTAETYVQIYERTAAPAAPAAAAAGIAGLPAGVGSIQQYVDERLKTERLKWEIQNLKDQLNAPASGWERLIDTLGALPGIDKVFQTVAIGLVTKFSPSAMPAIQQAMNGAPDAGEHGEDYDTGTDPQTAFAANIQESANMLGVDPVTLSAKLRNLIRQNPDMARQLMQ